MSESKKHDSLSAEELDGVAGGVFFGGIPPNRSARSAV